MVSTMDHMERQIEVEVDTGSDVTLLLYPQFVHGAHWEGIFPAKSLLQAYGLGGYFAMQYGVLNSLLMGRTEASHLTIFKMVSEPSRHPNRLCRGDRYIAARSIRQGRF